MVSSQAYYLGHNLCLSWRGLTTCEPTIWSLQALLISLSILDCFSTYTTWCAGGGHLSSMQNTAEYAMSNFGRHDNGGHESYLIDQQIALPLPYSHSESHPFGPGGSYHLSQPALHSYMAQFGPTYAQQSISPSIQHLASHYPTGPSFPPTPDQAGLQHQSLQCINQPHYLQSAAYLPLREAHSETEIENQESKNERTMLSEAIVPAPEGFPNAEEFDRLING